MELSVFIVAGLHTGHDTVGGWSDVHLSGPRTGVFAKIELPRV